MEIKVKAITPGRRHNIEAHACIEMQLDDGSMITVDDFRVIRNKYGELGVFPPTYSVTNGREYTYFPSVVFSTQLRRRIEDEILAAFEKR